MCATYFIFFNSGSGILTTHLSKTQNQPVCLQLGIPGKLGITRAVRMKSILLSMALFLAMNAVNGATYYSRVTGTFATAGTWSTSPTGTPTNATALVATDIFIIQSTHTVTLGAAQTVAQITINSGGILALATFNLTISGNWTNNGSVTGTSGRLTGSTGVFTNNGSISLSTGRLVQTTGTLTNSATGTITFSGAGTITFGTGNFVNNNTSANVNFGSSAITITGTAVNQTIGGFITTGRLSCTKTGGVVTLTGNVNSTGITMNGTGGTMNLGAGLVHTTIGTVILTAGTLNGGSSALHVDIVSTTAWSGTGTVFVPGTGTVDFGAAGAQTLSATGTKTFYNLTFSNSGIKTNSTTTVNNIFSLEGTATASAAPTYGASATLQYNTTTARTAGAEWLATFAATGGVIIANTGAITTNGNKVFNLNVPLTINIGSTLTTGANTFSFSGNLVNNGTWTASTGAITITGAGTQSIGTFTTTGLVSMTKASATATLTGNVNGGAFTMNGAAGTLDLGTGLTHTFTGAWTLTSGTILGNTSILNIGGAISGTGVTFTANTGTANYTGAAAQTIPAFTYYNLGFTGAGVKTLSGTTSVGNVLTVNSPSTLSLSSFTLNLTGSGTPLVNTGTFTPGTSTVNYTNAASTVIAAVNYNNLNGTGGNRTLAVTGTIGIAGVFTPGAGVYTVLNSTVDFNGAGAQTIPAFTFHFLITSNAGIKSILAATTVTCQTLTINNAATVEINADGGAKLDVLL